MVEYSKDLRNNIKEFVLKERATRIGSWLIYESNGIWQIGNSYGKSQITFDSFEDAWNAFTFII